MSKKSGYRPPVHERIGSPQISRDKDGNAILNCPFCNPTHPLRPENNSTCGTILQIRAVQIVYKAKFDKRMICIKCQKGGGEMVRFQNGYIHTHDCAPGVVTLEEPPPFSKFAERVYNMPEWLKGMTEGIFGKVIAVHEVEPNGERTGVTLGYFFRRKKEV